MKSLCLTLLTVFSFSPVIANAQAQSPYLRVTNKFGDYWVFRFTNTPAINVTFDTDPKTQKETDREIKLTDIDILASFQATVSQAAFRAQASNLAQIRLLCKQAGCVYSHYESRRYNELDIVCQNTQDCVTFVQGSLGLP